MKKTLFFILLITSAANGFGQFLPLLSYPNSVELFGLYEISFDLPFAYSNPYDPDIISVSADFTGPDNSSYTVNAFYYEDYTFQQDVTGYEKAKHNSSLDGWRIRFTPNKVGTWTFIIRAFDANGGLHAPFLNTNYTFSCTSVSNADGFISMANSRFLKRDIVRNGQRRFHSFFPTGPNIAWYNCLTYCAINKPLGIYYYEDHIDSLYNNANYMRIWLNRYQYLSLYGPEYSTIEKNDSIVFFDSTLNQKDAAELDHIISYAKQHDIAVLLSFFNQGDFLTNDDSCNPSEWANNPFHNVLSLDEPCSFFTDPDAIKITKNLIRYIISRWGYATNLMCWELWNEVDQAKRLCIENDEIDQEIEDWHNEMAAYIRNIDPFGHCISSSGAKVYDNPQFPQLYQNLDIVQQHNYQDIQRASSRFEIPYSLFLGTVYGHNMYNSNPKPFFMGEFGFSSNQQASVVEKDPMGVSLHNSLWSSFFSTSIGPASFWRWSYLDTRSLYKRFKPMTNFSKNLPILSATFTPHTTAEVKNEFTLVFPNGIKTYYMINSAEDTIMGWSQDTAFAYQSLRWLTDSVRTEYFTLPNDSVVALYYFKDSIPPFDTNGYIYTLNPLKKPLPSSNSNIITLPITNQPVGSSYLVRWYNSETGNAYPEISYARVNSNNQIGKYVSFQFPSHIRNLQKHTINNTFGDAVFILKLYNPPQKE